MEELFESEAIVNLCGVVVKPDEARLNIPIAFVELKSDVALTKEQAIQALTELAKKELPEHMQPESIHVIDTMPMTQSGKIDYRVLERMAEEV